MRAASAVNASWRSTTCETCADFFPIVKQLMADNPRRIRLSTHYVAFHDGSGTAVRVLEASRAQGKYWEALQTLFASQSRWAPNHRAQPELTMHAISGVGLDMARLHVDMNSAEVTQRIERDLSDAKSLKVAATPEFLVKGKPTPSFGEQQLRGLVAQVLSEVYWREGYGKSASGVGSARSRIVSSRARWTSLAA